MSRNQPYVLGPSSSPAAIFSSRQQPSPLDHPKNSLIFQIVKYILLILNILIVIITSIITIIVSLLPMILYEKKLQYDNLNELIWRADHPHQINGHQYNVDDHHQQPNSIPIKDLDTIRYIRYLILSLSSVVILNQTLAVYGLFKQRINHILISTIVLTIIGHLFCLFLLPASVFILILIYLLFSICYVIILNHRVPNRVPDQRSIPSRAQSIEPSSMTKHCCCRCKSCQCHNNPMLIADNAVLINRKASSSFNNHGPYGSVAPAINTSNTPYYYGSLGRGKSRSSGGTGAAGGGSTNQQDLPGSGGYSVGGVAAGGGAYGRLPLNKNNDPIYYSNNHRPPIYQIRQSTARKNQPSNMNLIDSTASIQGSRTHSSHRQGSTPPTPPTPPTTSVGSNYFSFEMSKSSDII